MELELHQLDRRYESLRTSCPRREGRLLASLDRHGQQLPVVVVAAAEPERYVLVDGYKRVRALGKLGRDTVRAVCWELREEEALLLGRLMHSAPRESAIEQGCYVQHPVMRSHRPSATWRRAEQGDRLRIISARGAQRSACPAG